MKVDEVPIDLPTLCHIATFDFEEVVLSPDPQEAAIQLADLRKRHALHHLTLEDMSNRNQRAKVEVYPNYLFLVWHYFQVELDAVAELHFVICAHTLLLVTNQRPAGGGTWRDRFFGAGNPLPPLVSALHLALDKCVDDAERFLDALNDAGTEFESAILDKLVDPREILTLKKHTIGFERAVSNFGNVLHQLVKLLQPQREMEFLFRDVADHVKRMQDDAEHLRLQLFAMLDVYWGALGTRSNVQMQKLTTLATLFIPFNLWAGFFGMNFESMPFKSHSFFLFGMGLMVVSFIGVAFYMFSRGLIRSRGKQFKFRDAFPGKNRTEQRVTKEE